MAYGTVNVDAMTTSDGYTSAGTYGFKNRIINGAFPVSQYNGTSSITYTAAGTNGGYPIDRFTVNMTVTGGSITCQQSTTAPTGFSKSFILTNNASVTASAGQRVRIYQAIEGLNIADLNWGSASAQTVTFSFWVRSSVTGTYAGGLLNENVDRSYVFTYTINSANTWEYKTITVAGDTSGTWPTTNGVGIYVMLDLGSGTSSNGTANTWNASYSYKTSGSVNWAGTNGATFYTTGWQLEKGSTATSFDYRPYGTELALCQRYYFRAVTGDAQAISMGGYYTSSDMRTVTYFPVPMRIGPSVVSATGTDYFRMQVNGGNDTFTTLLDGGPKTPTTIMLYNNLDMSGTAGQSGFVYSNSASASLAFNAEL